jgi:ribosomal protein S12 methylthiotransferase
MRQWVLDTKFDRLGCFTYSHEENTHAHTLVNDVPEEVKQQRVDEIMGIQQDISFQKNQEKVGHTYQVMIDKKEGDYFIGRTEFDSPEVDNEVLLDARVDYARVGGFVNVKIDRAEDFDLYGKIASPQPSPEEREPML